MDRFVAWLGGGVFVASLAYATYVYFVVLARSDASPEANVARAVLFNTVLFAVFALHHSILARTPAKRWLTQFVPERLERSSYVWVASVLLVAVCAAWQSVPGVVYAIPAPWSWAMYAVQIAGFAMTARATAMLDGLDLAGIRQVQGRHRLATEFRADGPFGFVRHPIYLGWVLIVFGAPYMSANRFVFAVLTTIYLILAIPWEEKSLVAASGDRYRAYQQRVRWRLVPGLW